MRHLLTILILFICGTVHAQDSIICTLSEEGNSQNFISTVANVSESKSDQTFFVESIDGIDIGTENYSFDMSITKQSDGSVLLDVVFYENNNIEDEVASYGWEIRQKGLLVVSEPLLDFSDISLMNFSCDFM